MKTLDFQQWAVVAHKDDAMLAAALQIARNAALPR